MKIFTLNSILLLLIIKQSKTSDNNLFNKNNSEQELICPKTPKISPIKKNINQISGNIFVEDIFPESKEKKIRDSLQKEKEKKNNKMSMLEFLQKKIIKKQ